MVTSNLTYLISHPELLNRDTLYELRTFLARYPYCQSLRLLFLKNLYLLRDASFGEELRKSVLYVGDRRVLFYLIEGDRYTLSLRKNELTGKAEIKEEPGLDRTLSLIDAFLSTIPEEDETKQVNNLQYIADYTPYLESDNFLETSGEVSFSGPPQLQGQELIDSFIDKAENEVMLIKPLEDEDISEEERIERLNALFPDDDDDDTYFTETLARIYIKQRRYEKALEIIEKLSLKYPKKNVYFADQIRFLEKLIINAKSK